MRSETGGIVLGWLFKLIVSLAVVGVCAFEAGAVVVARVNVDTVASEAAGEAAATFQVNHNARDAERTASDYAKSKGATFESFTVSDDERAVFVTVSKRASTLFLHRIGPTKSWAVARTTRRRGVV